MDKTHHNVLLSGSQSELDPIPDGGQAILNIDKERKTHCEYEHDRFIVTKTKPYGVMWRFTADRESGLALCYVGDIVDLNVAEEAQRCGLGTFFIKLCLVDSDMNGENGNVNGPLAADNEALENLDIPAYEEEHDWVKANCKSLWTLLFAADIGAAKGYFKAALDTGFTQMMIAEPVPVLSTADPKIHGPVSTEYWRESYDARSGLIRQLINVRSAHWFFCNPVEGL